jgi:hypothetical protein
MYCPWAASFRCIENPHPHLRGNRTRKIQGVYRARRLGFPVMARLLLRLRPPDPLRLGPIQPPPHRRRLRRAPCGLDDRCLHRDMVSQLRLTPRVATFRPDRRLSILGERTPEGLDGIQTRELINHAMKSIQGIQQLADDVPKEQEHPSVVDKNEVLQLALRTIRDIK